MGRTVYVYRTHVLNDRVWNMFEKIQTEYGRENSYMLLDDTSNSCPKGLDYTVVRCVDNKNIPPAPAVLLINELECEIVNPLHKQFNMPGTQYRCEAHVISAFRKVGDFEYMWFIEYDIYVHGSIKTALAPCDHMQEDLLTTHLKADREVEEWVWRNDLFGIFADVPMNRRFGSLFSINRFSYRFLSLVETILGRGTGFCEILFPTAAVFFGCTIASIPSKCLGVFEYRPVLPDNYFDDKPINDKLYHPYKAFDVRVYDVRKEYYAHVLWALLIFFTCVFFLYKILCWNSLV